MSIANVPASVSTPPTSAAAAGKSYRLGRIFADDGRTVILPVDHGTMLGRVAGLEDPVGLIRSFLPLRVRRIPARTGRGRADGAAVRDAIGARAAADDRHLLAGRGAAPTS